MFYLMIIIFELVIVDFWFNFCLNRNIGIIYLYIYCAVFKGNLICFICVEREINFLFSGNRIDVLFKVLYIVFFFWLVLLVFKDFEYRFSFFYGKIFVNFFMY